MPFRSDLAKRKGLSASQYDFHALSWLQYEYLQQGKVAKAAEAMTRVEEALSDSAEAGRHGQTGGRSDGSRGFSRAEQHQHVESEIGRGYGPAAPPREAG